MEQNHEMANAMNKFSKKGHEWQLKYSKTFLKDISDKINNMLEDNFDLNHIDTYANLHMLTASFISRLKEGDYYETITFPPFWSDDMHNFENANYKAIGKGAKIYRVLIVDLENTTQQYKLETKNRN